MTATVPSFSYRQQAGLRPNGARRTSPGSPVGGTVRLPSEIALQNKSSIPPPLQPLDTRVLDGWNVVTEFPAAQLPHQVPAAVPPSSSPHSAPVQASQSLGRPPRPQPHSRTNSYDRARQSWDAEDPFGPFAMSVMSSSPASPQLGASQFRDQIISNDAPLHHEGSRFVLKGQQQQQQQAYQRRSAQQQQTMHSSASSQGATAAASLRSPLRARPADSGGFAGEPFPQLYTSSDVAVASGIGDETDGPARFSGRAPEGLLVAGSPQEIGVAALTNGDGQPPKGDSRSTSNVPVTSPNQSLPTFFVAQHRVPVPSVLATHWQPVEALAPTPQRTVDGTHTLNPSDGSLAAVNKALHDSLQSKDEEIMKLRASLVVALQCYAYAPEPGIPSSRAEQQFLSAVTNAVATPDAPPTLMVQRGPPHVEGLPNVPMPLDLNSMVGQFYGTLDMMETEEKTIFKKAWKPRFVVADQHGVTVFRDEADFKQHAFHRAVLNAPYHSLEYFVPSFRNPVIPEMLQRATAQNDNAVAALTQMQLIAAQHAVDPHYAYFGFVSKQHPSTVGGGGGSQKKGGNNPQLVFRTRSVQVHSDWAHFLAKCFNMRLYRDMFPTMLAETMFGLICKGSQTDPDEAPAADSDTHHGDAEALLSPPPPLPPGPPGTGGLVGSDTGAPISFPVETSDAETVTDVVPVRVQCSQTEELAQWVSQPPMESTDVADDEHVALQRHIVALEAQCAALRSEGAAAREERDASVEHAAIVQASLAVAEKETKRLRQAIVEEHEKALEWINSAKRDEDDVAKTRAERLAECELRESRLVAEVATLQQEKLALQNELAQTKVTLEQRVRSLAQKAVTDIDELHSRMVGLSVGDVTPPQQHPPPVSNLDRRRPPHPHVLSPPRSMMLEGDDMNQRLGALIVLCNRVGDVQFQMEVEDGLCSITRANEIRSELRKTWTLRSGICDGEIEIGACLRWDAEDDDGDEDDSQLQHSDASSVGLAHVDDDDEDDDDEDHNGYAGGDRNPSSPSRLHGTRYPSRTVHEETTQTLFDRLQRIPVSVLGRVGLQPSGKKKPFVPFV